jgi:hypothetical protein
MLQSNECVFLRGTAKMEPPCVPNACTQCVWPRCFLAARGCPHFLKHQDLSQRCIHMRGLARSSAEVVYACLAPRVWVWGVWFGFTLRCVALLCGVFVRLRLALFPAGGPFLPSLYVNIYIYSYVECFAPGSFLVLASCGVAFASLEGPRRCTPFPCATT